MEYFNNILCMPANMYYHVYEGKPGQSKVVKENYVPYGTYKTQAHNGIINIVRKAHGEGNYALIEFASIPPKYRAKIHEDIPNPEKEAVQVPFLAQVKKDIEAMKFYVSFRYTDGSPIPTDKVDNITLWTNNASIMNVFVADYEKHVKQRAKLSKKPLNAKFFRERAELLLSENLQRQYPNNLPKNATRLQQKFFEYRNSSYIVFVKNYVGNDNSIKITDKHMRLLNSIATMPTRPYNTMVVDIYMAFMTGERELLDHVTGEYFDRAEYLDENGEIVEFTEQAYWYRRNQVANQILVDKKTMGAKDYNDLHRPHRHRHAPYFSFSKITMDDRDLVWKDSTTGNRVKAYYAYDVASGCRIGSAYSMDKNEELFLDCLRDMFVFIDRNGLGIPLEVEVENHLVNLFEYELKQMFPLVHFCAPSNSQEKRAEHLNRYVKYQIEKNNHPGIGRWWLTSKYNRVSVDRVGAEYKQRMKPAERLIVDDIQDTIEYNNSLHPNQKLYEGKTRMQVLLDNVNPNLPQLQKEFIYQYIGYQTETSIQRNQYVQVQYADYMLPHPAVLERLGSNNREVTAYYMPDGEGSINEVYLYQNGRFICTCDKLITYNEAIAERTDEDKAAKLKQDKYVAMFDKYVKEGTKDFAKISHHKTYDDTEVLNQKPKTLPALPREPLPVNTDFDYAADYKQKAYDDFFN